MKHQLWLPLLGVALLEATSAVLAMMPGSAVAQSAEPADQAVTLAVVRDAERMGREPLWPGFDPNRIPLAIYTGEHTYLFRHPAPPEGFVKLAEGVFVLKGRHPAIFASTPTKFGETVAAVVEAVGLSSNPAAADLRRLSATVMHESFHVHQLQRHPGWSANEAATFLYPVDDARLLALRRLESLAWSRALSTKDSRALACWAQRGVEYRQQRFAAMDTDFGTYERQSELNEGVPSYVEMRARGETSIDIPATEFAPTDVRQRAYVMGPVLAVLLDKLQPGWQAALTANDRQSLDQMLAAALSNQKPSSRCAVKPAEVAAIERAATNDVAVLAEARTASRRQFDALPGWRIVIVGEAGALQLQGFDPQNVELLPPSVLHTRYLRLGNANGSLQLLQERGAALKALTEAAGRHPLFEGVKRITIAGAEKPDIVQDEQRVKLSTAGFTAEFKHAVVKIEDTQILVRLSSAP